MELSNMKMFHNLSVCRICLENSEDEMICVYEKDEQNMKVLEKIEIICNSKLATDPDLPTNICRKCNLFLAFSFKFHLMCSNSQRYLHEFGLKGFEEDEIEFEETEYLSEYNPIEEDEQDFKDEFWVEAENENENGIQFDADDTIVSSSKAINRQVPQQTEKKRPLKHPEKTLAMSPDGEALIRINNSRILENELKKNKSHICDVCGNIYPKKYALDAHMRRHRNERPFECEICQHRFTYNFQLTRHILKHTGARPYNCIYCQRSFTDRSTMKKHERLHRNERPYKCDTCNKTFTYSSVLKVHKLTHTGEKPYNCGICGKRFARAHHLRAHLETLLHSKDPQAKLLLKQIRREEGAEEDA